MSLTRREVIARTALGALGVSALDSSAWAAPQETKEQHDARMKWWRDARFGMFIHWGLYAVPAGTYQGKQIGGIGEWIMSSADIPREEYEKFAPQFNPVKFNAAEWVRIAKGAGMKYIVITSKHHDGFAMFDSKVSDYCITHRTPFKRDPLLELSRECRRQGLKFCTYHSILDWHHPAQYVTHNAQNPRGNYGNNDIHPERKAEYIAYMKGELQEILDKYDPAVLWFDGEWVKWWEEEDGKDLYRWLRERRPNLIINNRIGKGRKGMEGLSKDDSYAGDFGTPEQEIPANGLRGVDWESCMTMNDTWGFKSFDHNWKSAATLIHNLVDCASKGGNFLLNVGPTAEGEIPGPSQERLAAVGRWMKANSDSIYATSASPLSAQPAWGRITVKPGRVFLHVFNRPADGKLRIPSLPRMPRGAYLVEERGHSLPVERAGDGIVVSLPPTLPDADDTVIALL